MTETPNPLIVDADTLTGEMRPIRRAVLALGSNLGERLASIQGAVNALADTPDVWITEVANASDYAKAAAKTDLDPTFAASLPASQKCG